MRTKIGVPGLTDPGVQEDLQAICRIHHVKKLMAFGSTVRGTAAAESDLDIIAEFFPGMTPGFAFARLGRELSSILGRKIDLHTAGSLSQYFREDVLREARVIYACED